MTALPEAELAFYFAAMATLESEQRPIFADRVAAILPFASPGPGDVDCAIRSALAGLWIPPRIEEVRLSSRWDRAVPRFERVSKSVG